MIIFPLGLKFGLRASAGSIGGAHTLGSYQDHYYSVIYRIEKSTVLHLIIDYFDSGFYSELVFVGLLFSKQQLLPLFDTTQANFLIVTFASCE